MFLGAVFQENREWQGSICVGIAFEGGVVKVVMEDVN